MVVYCRSGGGAVWKQAGLAEVVDLGEDGGAGGDAGGGGPQAIGPGAGRSSGSAAGGGGAGQAGAASSSSSAGQAGAGRGSGADQRQGHAEAPSKRRRSGKCSAAGAAGQTGAPVLREATAAERGAKARRVDAGLSEEGVEEIVLEHGPASATPVRRRACGKQPGGPGSPRVGAGAVGAEAPGVVARTEGEGDQQGLSGDGAVLTTPKRRRLCGKSPSAPRSPRGGVGGSAAAGAGSTPTLASTELLAGKRSGRIAGAPVREAVSASPSGGAVGSMDVGEEDGRSAAQGAARAGGAARARAGGLPEQALAPRRSARLAGREAEQGWAAGGAGDSASRSSASLSAVRSRIVTGFGAGRVNDLAADERRREAEGAQRGVARREEGTRGRMTTFGGDDLDRAAGGPWQARRR